MREMKDSGNDWLQTYPADWNVAHAKYFVSIGHGCDPKTKGNIPVYGSGAESFKTCGEYKEGPAVLLGRKGTIDKPFYVTEKYWNVDTAFDVKPIKQFNLQFYYYLASVFDYTHYITQTTVPSMTQSDYLNMSIPIPDYLEQTAIVSYLDRCCAAIDRTIKATKASIDKLKEYKSALIARAVTKGLNPDAEMKDSGMEWIGEMPAHWQFIRTKYLFEIMKRIAGTEGYDVLAITQQGIKVKDLSSNKGQLSLDYSKYQLVYPGDFAMNHMDLLTGWMDLSDKAGVTSPDYRVFRKCSPLVYDKYYRYVFQNLYTTKVYYGLAQGVAEVGRKRLQAPAFLDFKLPVPLVDEQKAIVAYLDSERKSIDNLIAKKEQLITKFTEYRKSLIYHVVTGKIDCREEETA